MAKIKLKHLGDGVYKALLIPQEGVVKQVVFNNVTFGMVAHLDDSGNYGTICDDADEDIANVDEWDCVLRVESIDW